MKRIKMYAAPEADLTTLGKINYGEPFEFLSFNMNSWMQKGDVFILVDDRAYKHQFKEVAFNNLHPKAAIVNTRNGRLSYFTKDKKVKRVIAHVAVDEDGLCSG